MSCTVALSVRLRIVAAVAHHGDAAASGAAHALRPAMLPYQGEALGVVDQRGEIDQVRCGHGGKRSFDGGELPSCFYQPSAFSARPSCLPLTTPDPEKSLIRYKSLLLSEVCPEGRPPNAR